MSGFLSGGSDPNNCLAGWLGPEPLAAATVGAGVASVIVEVTWHNSDFF